MMIIIRKKMSVQAPPQSKPIEIFFAQDKSVFSQFLFPTRAVQGQARRVGSFQNQMVRDT